MKPIGKYLVIKPIQEELKTASGLLLSNEDANNFRYHKGKVIESGTDIDVINKDDLIYYDKAAGHQMFINDESYTVILERDVVVVI